MRRSVMAGAIVLAAVLCVAITTPAHAKAQSFLDGMIKAFSADKNNYIIELRRCKDQSYDIIYYKKAEDKVVMLKVKGKDSVTQTPLRTYDIEMIKKLNGDLGKALMIFVNSEPAKGTTMQIWGANFEVKNGRPKFFMHCFTPMGEVYRRSFPIDGMNWQHVTKKDEIKLDPDPISVPWSEEEKAAGNNDFPAEFVGKGAAGSTATVDSTAAKSDKSAEAAKDNTGTGSDEAVTSRPNGGNGQGPRGRRNRANRNKQNQDAAE